MFKPVIFGGTTEGRKLCEYCAAAGIPVIYCVVTGDGARPVEALPYIDIRMGRLDSTGMKALLAEESHPIAVDATHPYAEEASLNIAMACQNTGIPLLRLTRESAEEPGCIRFGTMDAILAWLEREPGNIFVTTGASHAVAFAGLTGYRERVWLRILPSLDSLRVCLAAGYRPERLICMQGPFSEELNRAMFKAAGCRILVTKNSGAAGGFTGKVRAAQSLGMLAAVLERPEVTDGVPFEEACKRIMELCV